MPWIASSPPLSGSSVADADPRLASAVDWQTVARLVLTSRAMDRVEEERLVPEKITWDMPLPVAPMAIPGKTRFA